MQLFWNFNKLEYLIKCKRFKLQISESDSYGFDLQQSKEMEWSNGVLHMGQDSFTYINFVSSGMFEKTEVLREDHRSPASEFLTLESVPEWDSILDSEKYRVHKGQWEVQGP